MSMKKFIELLNSDKEIQELKKKYKEKYGRCCPFSIDEHGTIERYKDDLRKSVNNDDLNDK